MGEGSEKSTALRPSWKTEGMLRILGNEVGGEGSGQIRENLETQRILRFLW